MTARRWPVCLLAGVLAAAAAHAQNDCRALERHGRLNDAHRCFQGLAGSPDRALRAEGLWGLERYDAANAEFRVLVREHPESAAYRVRWGRLLLERFNTGDAGDLFEEALKIDPKNAGAALGLALIASERFNASAVDLARQAIEFDPKLVEARELYAYLLLENNEPGKASEAADEALKIAPDALDALAIHATIEWLHGSLLDGEIRSPWMDRAALINPVYGRGYALAAHFFVLNRRYAEGIRLYRKATELNPRLWEARSELGINLMRLGRNDEARAQLVMCYENGFRNLETVNSLRLLDSFRNFETVTEGNAVLVLNRKEADLLKPYFGELVNRAMKTYEAKYRFRLPGMVRLEVYPDHEDFAVRTSGMPGLGALGVTFGTVVAMDSPSGRPPGQFHWGSTLWHEMSHVYVLTITKHLAPRWFTEGLAVYEESIAAPGWGDRLQPEEVRAVKERKLLPVLEMDRGFIRPTYPSQVVVSYFEAGRMCAFIAEKWNYSKLVDMLYAFASRKTTGEVIEEILGLKPEEFDRQFLAWLEPRVLPVSAHFEEWRKGAARMAQLAAEKKYDDAIQAGKAIEGFYPDYVEADSVYEQLAAVYVKKGDKASAVKELNVYWTTGGRNRETLKKLAELEAEEGNPVKAIAVLESLNYIYPEDQQLHQRLGTLYLNEKKPEGAIREFHALLALKPLDQAASHYDMARAYKLAGRGVNAREEVLLALEAAPDFKPAQKLLLELSDEK
ncbi:MAG TPA: tetratricopeptide repeat protein [Bryobacteraceae bacterium]|jgi:tetratricopeptide (TPR) repeat protein|nr:tetratricopeptide repeat protein [Bryobacteraceae bacterium]